MSKYSKSVFPRNHNQDLFDWWRERELRRTNPAVRRIARRFGVSLHHAEAIATNAGIGPEATR